MILIIGRRISRVEKENEKRKSSKLDLETQPKVITSIPKPNINHWIRVGKVCGCVLYLEGGSLENSSSYNLHYEYKFVTDTLDVFNKFLNCKK